MQNDYLKTVQCRFKALSFWLKEEKGLKTEVNKDIKGIKGLHWAEKMQLEKQTELLFKAIPLIISDPYILQNGVEFDYMVPKTQVDLRLFNILGTLRTCIKGWESALGEDVVCILLGALDLISTSIGKRYHIPVRFDDDS